MNNLSFGPVADKKIVLKGWGFELWIVNNENYCGKILHFNKGKYCSYHKHKLKKEHFYCVFGKVKVLYGWTDSLGEAVSCIMNPGDVFEVPPGLNHRMIGLEESELFEISTEHFEDDSCRIEKGC